MSSIIVQRQPANRPGPDIINPLLADNVAKREKGRALINHNEDDRKIVTGDGPRSQFMTPGDLAELHIKGRTMRGAVTLYSRTYVLNGSNYQINSSISVETLSKAQRPEPI